MQHLLAQPALLLWLSLGTSYCRVAAKAQQESVTVLQIHKPVVRWTIRNFGLFRDKSPNSYTISSPVIYEDQWGHWEMSAVLKPTEVESSSPPRDYYGQHTRTKTSYWSLEVQIVATNISGQVFSPPASISAAVLGGVNRKTLLDKASLQGATKHWYLPTFIKTKHLEDNLETYAPANDLTVWFEITQESSFHLLKYNQIESAEGDTADAASSRTNLTSQLFHAYQEAKWTDSKLKSNDGLVIPVHKVVMASMSTVLDAQLRNNTEISIDLSGNSLKEFVRFLYTGELSKTVTVAEHLLAAAEKYQVASLMEECQQMLMDSLTSESVAKLLVLAETHNAQKLKSVALDFVLRNFQQVSKTATWKKTLKTHPELTVDSVMAVVAKFTNG